MTSYDPSEQDALMTAFAAMLQAVTKDGGAKRARDDKPPWWQDDGHTAALYRHIEAWESGEKHDPDSGAHPLIGAAWRALAIAYRETYGSVDPCK